LFRALSSIWATTGWRKKPEHLFLLSATCVPTEKQIVAIGYCVVSVTVVQKWYLTFTALTAVINESYIMIYDVSLLPASR